MTEQDDKLKQQAQKVAERVTCSLCLDGWTLFFAPESGQGYHKVDGRELYCQEDEVENRRVTEASKLILAALARVTGRSRG